MSQRHHTLFALFLTGSLLYAKIPANKLQYQYELYYLPFEVDFRPGTKPGQIIPLAPKTKRLIRAEELQAIDQKWDTLRTSWRKRSLFLATPNKLNQTTRISPHLIHHVVPLSLNALDSHSIEEQIQINSALKTKPRAIQSKFLQLKFLKSFLNESDKKHFNFFVVGPHWCESTREYRMILESYVKQFPHPKLNLHTVVIMDPKEEIFGSKILTQLFPEKTTLNPEGSVPSFVAIEFVKGKPRIWSEGEALKILLDRYLGEHEGYLQANPTKIPINRSLSSKKK